MHSIEFEADFVDQKKKVRISQPSGSEGYQVIIDGYYQGILFKKDGQWTGHLNEKSELTAEDIQALGERIDAIP